MRLNELARIMKTAGEESRLQILCLIFESRKICVSDIAKKLKMSVAIVSHHLQVMANEGMLKPTQEGECTFYLLSNEKFIADLKRFICAHK